MSGASPLPGALAEVEAIAGREAALALALALGGDRIYVPRREYIDPDHRLARAAGIETARALAERFAGEILDVPMAHRALVRHLAARGEETGAIAHRLGISRSTVRRYRK